MKKVLIVGLISLTTFSAGAHGPHGGHGYGHSRPHYHNGWNWVLPAVIGGVVVYEATKPPVVVQQPPVLITQPPVVQQQYCSPWIETRNQDGSTILTRTCQ